MYICSLYVCSNPTFVDACVSAGSAIDKKVEFVQSLFASIALHVDVSKAAKGIVKHIYNKNKEAARFEEVNWMQYSDVLREFCPSRKVCKWFC